MTQEDIFQNIIDFALLEGKKVIEKYYQEHEDDKYWSVCLGDMYITGDSEFAKWYRKKMKTREDKVAIKNDGGYKYEGAMMWASTVKKILSEFGINTINDIHLD